MFSEDSVAFAMKEVVELHLPMTKREFTYDSEFSTWSELHAMAIVEADIYDTDYFGVSRDVEKLEDLDRALINVRRISVSLSPPTQRALARLLSCSWVEGENPLIDVLASNEILHQSLKQIRSQSTYRKKASRKRNWRAISVAQACKSIWGEELVGEAYEARGEVAPTNALSFTIYPQTEWEYQQERHRKYRFEVATRAPKHVQNDTPGPFGLFLEDAFTVLGITSNSGEPIRAASALRSLREFEDKQ